MVHHYLDNFITIEPLGWDVCKANLDRILAVCGDLSVPLAIEKLEGPFNCIVFFLSIEIDNVHCELCLPVAKLIHLQAPAGQIVIPQVLPVSPVRVSCWHSPACLPGDYTRENLPPQNLLCIPGATQGHHHIRLDREFRADLQSWITFAEYWNGATIFPCPSECARLSHSGTKEMVEPCSIFGRPDPTWFTTQHRSPGDPEQIWCMCI